MHQYNTQALNVDTPSPTQLNAVRLGGEQAPDQRLSVLSKQTEFAPAGQQKLLNIKTSISKTPTKNLQKNSQNHCYPSPTQLNAVRLGGEQAPDQRLSVLSKQTEFAPAGQYRGLKPYPFSSPH